MVYDELYPSSQNLSLSILFTDSILMLVSSTKYSWSLSADAGDHLSVPGCPVRTNSVHIVTMALLTASSSGLGMAFMTGACSKM